MRNKDIDLRNHLFAQLERLNQEDLTPKQLEKEKERTLSMISVSKQIVDIEKTRIMEEKNQIAHKKIALDAMKLLQRSGRDLRKEEGMKQLMPAESVNQQLSS